MSRGVTTRLADLSADPLYQGVARAITSPRDLVRPEVIGQFPAETGLLLKKLFAASLSPVFLISLGVVAAGFVLSLWFSETRRRTV
jgi:hypothetical protein